MSSKSGLSEPNRYRGAESVSEQYAQLDGSIGGSWWPRYFPQANHGDLVAAFSGVRKRLPISPP
jgi:hypothetical protein